MIVMMFFFYVGLIKQSFLFSSTCISKSKLRIEQVKNRTIKKNRQNTESWLTLQHFNGANEIRLQTYFFFIQFLVVLSVVPDDWHTNEILISSKKKIILITKQKKKIKNTWH